MKRVISCAALAAALSGCTMSPGELDQSAVYSSVRVNGDVEDVYYQLTNKAPASSRCADVVGQHVYPKQKMFKVYYGSNTFNGITVFDSAVAQQIDDQVLVEFRTITYLGTPVYVGPVTRFLTSGNCI